MDRLPAYLDGFLEFPGWPGLPEQAYDTGAVPRFLQAAQARGFDLAIQLHGNGTLTNAVVALLGATRTAAFCTPGAFVPEPALSVCYLDEGPEICRALHLIEHLGYPSRGVGLEFPVRTADRLGGLTDLGMLAALLEGARLLVCSDTGVSHLAAALGTLSHAATGASPTWCVPYASCGATPSTWCMSSTRPCPSDGDAHRACCQCWFA